MQAYPYFGGLVRLALKCRPPSGMSWPKATGGMLYGVIVLTPSTAERGARVSCNSAAHKLNTPRGSKRVKARAGLVLIKRDVKTFNAEVARNRSLLSHLLKLLPFYRKYCVRHATSRTVPPRVSSVRSPCLLYDDTVSATVFTLYVSFVLDAMSFPL